MTIKHLRIFLTVCETGSITGAAKKLYLSQPAASLAIKELEEYYGVRLFERFARRIEITEAGRRLYDFAVNIIRLYGEMDRELKNWNSKGILRIGSSITVGTCLMTDFITNFRKSHPQIRPYVKIDSSDIIESLVEQNKLDLAVIEGTVHSENIISEKLIDDNLAVICSDKNPLKNKKNVYLKDLQEQFFLLREKNSGTRELADSVLMLHGIFANPTWESTSTEALMHAVSANLGISILPYRLVISQMPKYNVVILPIKDAEFTRSFSIIYHKNKFMSPICLEFIDTVKDLLSKSEY